MRKLQFSVILKPRHHSEHPNTACKSGQETEMTIFSVEWFIFHWNYSGDAHSEVA